MLIPQPDTEFNVLFEFLYKHAGSTMALETLNDDDNNVKDIIDGNRGAYTPGKVTKVSFDLLDGIGVIIGISDHPTALRALFMYYNTDDKTIRTIGADGLECDHSDLTECAIQAFYHARCDTVSVAIQDHIRHEFKPPLDKWRDECVKQIKQVVTVITPLMQVMGLYQKYLNETLIERNPDVLSGACITYSERAARDERYFTLQTPVGTIELETLLSASGAVFLGVDSSTAVLAYIAKLRGCTVEHLLEADTGCLRLKLTSEDLWLLYSHCFGQTTVTFTMGSRT